MRIFIPPLKTKLILTKDWRFTLFDERRNHDLAITLGVKENKPGRYGWPECNDEAIDDVICPAKTVLMIDRIYIRNGAKDFDSVTFRVVGPPPDARWKGARFWAKLLDVNTLECEMFEEAPELSKKDSVLVKAEKSHSWIYHPSTARYYAPVLMRVDRVDFKEERVHGEDIDGRKDILFSFDWPSGKECRMEAHVGYPITYLSSKVRIVNDLTKATLAYHAEIAKIKARHR